MSNNKKDEDYIYRRKEIKFYSLMLKGFYENGMIEEKYKITISSCAMVCLSILMFTSKVKQIYLQPIAFMYLCACFVFMIVIFLAIRTYTANKSYILQIIENKELTAEKTLKRLDTISLSFFVISFVFSFSFLFLLCMAYIRR